MNTELFERLVDQNIREVTDRHPDYFRYHPLGMLNESALAKLTPPGFPDGQLTRAMEVGQDVLKRRGIVLTTTCGGSSPISTTIAAGVLDSYMAAIGQLPLVPQSPISSRIFDALCGRYELKKTKSGTCYVMRQGIGSALLIVSAVGVPLDVWSALLDETDISRPLLIVQTRSTPLLEGGVSGGSNLAQDATDLHDVLCAEGLEGVDVVAWCSGARIAVCLLERIPERISSLMLIAPTFHGSVDSKAFPSPFEDSFATIAEMWRRDPSSAVRLLQALARAPQGQESTSDDETNAQAEAVLRLIPHAYARRLLVPLSRKEYCLNYVERCDGDKRYDIHAAIAKVRCPVLLVIGTHDAATNTGAASNVLKACGSAVLTATLLGAGHHIHLLQYSYLRHILMHFLSRKPFFTSARLTFELLAQCR